MLFMPKSAAVFVLTIFSQLVLSQTNWQDNFTDSNFTQNPTWVGDTGSFIINAQKQLQLNAPAVSATKRLSTPSTCGIEATWEFFIHMDFNPSSNNFASVYLMSSDNQVNTGSTGYFVRVGGSSTDKISVYRKDGGTTHLVMESNSDLLDASAVNARIRVTRNAQHHLATLC